MPNDVLGAVLGATAIVVAVFMAILVGLYFWWRGREYDYKAQITQFRTQIETLESDLNTLSSQNATLAKKIDNLMPKLETLEKTNEGAAKFSQVLNTIKSKRYDLLMTETWEALQQGIVRLTMKNFFVFWADMHSEDIVFFRVTSRIDPRLWLETDEMKLYQSRQLANIKAYLERSEVEREKTINMIKQKFPHGIDPSRNFERIFIIEESSKNDPQILESLSSIIHNQKVVNGLHIKVVCVGAKEKPMPTRPQDFGIVLTENNDTLLMDLEVSSKGEVGGGRIIFNEGIIKSYMDVYRKIDEKSTVVTDDVAKDKGEIKTLIQSLRPVIIFEENRCLRCFEISEKIVEREDWKKDTTPKRMWYEILDAENQRIRTIVSDLRPRRILEIGCGPGRIINVVLSTAHNENIPVERIIGFEQNPEIYAYAFKRFMPHINVYIRHHLFGNGGGKVDYDSNFFDLTIGVSNIVGWQENEIEWIAEAFRASKNFFFTVYERGFEDRRKRMYEALGDEVTYVGENLQLSMVDAFGKAPRITKSYRKDDVERFAREVLQRFKGSTYSVFKVSNYMFGCLLTKEEGK